MQKTLDAALEKAYRGVRLEVGEELAAEWLFALLSRGADHDYLPEWALEVLREYPIDLGHEPALPREPQRRRTLPSLMDERAFARHLVNERT